MTRTAAMASASTRRAIWSSGSAKAMKSIICRPKCRCRRRCGTSWRRRFDAKTGRATLYQEGVGNRYNSLLGKVAPIDYRSHVSEVFRFRQKNLPETPFLMAGSRDWHETARPLRLADCIAARSIGAACSIAR